MTKSRTVSEIPQLTKEWDYEKNGDLNQQTLQKEAL